MAAKRRAGGCALGPFNQGGASDCGIRAGAVGVFVDVVAVPQAGGHLTVFPPIRRGARPPARGRRLPGASTLNFHANHNVTRYLLPVGP